MSARPLPHRQERGLTLVEMLIAILVLTTGILVLGRLIPAASRGQVTDKMMTQASAYAQQKIESLQVLTWSDPSLTNGRHPSANTNEPLGTTGQWQRSWEITTLATPLDNLKKVTVTVNWTFLGAHSVTATTYLRR
ncbi:MAG TPA: type II secretion system protein [Candidatus Eisenbacteria bacterium]|jgi:type II secretory pathway pseudopilin PulG